MHHSATTRHHSGALCISLLATLLLAACSSPAPRQRRLRPAEISSSAHTDSAAFPHDTLRASAVHAPASPLRP